MMTDELTDQELIAAERRAKIATEIDARRAEALSRLDTTRQVPKIPARPRKAAPLVPSPFGVARMIVISAPSKRVARVKEGVVLSVCEVATEARKSGPATTTFEEKDVVYVDLADNENPHAGWTYDGSTFRAP